MPQWFDKGFDAQCLLQNPIACKEKVDAELGKSNEVDTGLTAWQEARSEMWILNWVKDQENAKN
jgi:hypothetical protein